MTIPRILADPNAASKRVQKILQCIFGCLARPSLLVLPCWYILAAPSLFISFRYYTSTMKKILSFLTIAFALLIPSIASAAAAPPLVVVGPGCAAGSARVSPFMVFEDRNGDGAYDYITAFSCDGSSAGWPWTPGSVTPFTPPDNAIPVGVQPTCAMNTTYTFTSAYDTPSGLYTWTVTERNPAVGPGPGIIVSVVKRNASGSMSVSVNSDCSSTGGAALE